MPPPPSRIEVIPIQWYERIHGPNSLMKSLSSVTIDSIQSLRSIANDVVFDVLMYLTPEFCYETLDCVLGQINDIYTKFISINNGYVRNGGQFGLIGHSLGSVISWDMLSIHKQWKHEGIIDLTEVDDDDSQSLRKQPQVVSSPLRGTDFREERSGLSKQTKANDGHTDKDRTVGPNLSRKMKKSLPFEPSFTCFLGSPLGQFLSLRGAHTLFEQIRTVHTEQELANGLKRSLKQSTSPFTLPTKAVYNIFHPSDPVAYRIEPLLMSPDVEKHDLPKPLMIEPGGEYCVNESFRPEVFAQKVRGYLSKEPSTWISDTLKITPPQPSSWMPGTLKMNPPSFVKQLSMAYSSSSDTSDKAIESAGKKIEVIDEKIPPKFALSGTSDRLDFQLHTGLIENEYVSSVSAHSSYFSNSDVIDFIVGIAVVKSINHQ